MTYLLTILRVIGAIFGSILVAIVAAFVVGIVVNAFFPYKAPGVFEEVIMIGVIAVFAAILLVGIDRTRHKIALNWAQRYLQSQPRTDLAAFSAAFPQYDVAFLKKFRETVARIYGVEEECIGPDFDLAATRSLRHFVFDVELALFDAFTPQSNASCELLFCSSVAQLLKEAKDWSTGEQGQESP